MQLIILLCLFLLSQSVFARRLTNEENLKLKKTCGAERLKTGPYTLKSMHGEKVEINMFPWMAALLFPKGACSAVQISSRHILTAAHCLMFPKCDINSTELCNAFMQGSVDPKIVTRNFYTASSPEDITVYISSACERPELCPDKAKFSITKPPQIREEYNPCTTPNDLALIELDNDIPSEVGTPICMRENEKLAHKLTSVGYGIDPDHPDPEEFNLHWPQKIDFYSENVKESDTIITTFHHRKSTCAGDSGGPLVQLDHENKYVLVGILSSGNFECNKTISDNQMRENHFINLRGHLDWVCTHSGVCPIQKMGSHHDKSDFPKEHISIEVEVFG